MRAIILAAGRGSRMVDLTKEKPKCLTIVNGKSLIEHQILALKKAGIQDIVVVTGYKADCLKPYGNKHCHNPKWAKTNMVASLICAKEYLDQGDCIISYSDIFYNPEIVRKLMACEDAISIAYDPNWLLLWAKRFDEPLEDAETFRINEDGYLLEIGQRAKTVDEIQGQYMGLLKFTKGFWDSYLSTRDPVIFDKIDMTSFLSGLLENDYKIKALPNFGSWGECDNQNDVKLYQEQYLAESEQNV